jgi:aryl-alcohol dehydrogenase-like predicted oxidoreductase
MNTAPLTREALGSTGIEVSRLGLGTVKIGRNAGVKYPTSFELPDDNRVREIIALAKDRGINLIDTAPAYGRSEERIGELLTQRQDWVICSKVGEEFDNGSSHFDFSAEHVRHSIERSLKRLRTEYIDIVLVHSDGNDVDIINNTDCFAVLNECREKGLIRAFGMSTKTVEGGLLALEHSDIAMVTYHSAHREEESVIDRALALNKGILIKKALNSGHALSDVQDAVEANLRYIFKHPGVSSVIIGSINPLHMAHNIDIAIAAQT